MTAPSTSLVDVTALVAGDMLEMDKVIARRLDSGVPLVGQVARYIISAGGKRLRAVLLLLTCGALGNNNDQRFTLAAVIEFIHTATLLHDDVVRRIDATAGAIDGKRGFWQPSQRSGG